MRCGSMGAGQHAQAASILVQPFAPRAGGHWRPGDCTRPECHICAARKRQRAGRIPVVGGEHCVVCARTRVWGWGVAGGWAWGGGVGALGGKRTATGVPPQSCRTRTLVPTGPCHMHTARLLASPLLQDLVAAGNALMEGSANPQPSLDDCAKSCLAEEQCTTFMYCPAVAGGHCRECSGGAGRQWWGGAPCPSCVCASAHGNSQCVCTTS